MAFTEFLNEGAIALSTSMKSFSEKTVETIFSDLKKHVTYTYAKKKLDGSIIHEAKIESKFIDKTCRAIYSFKNDGTDATLSDSGDIIVNISEELHTLIQEYFGKYNTKLKSEITKKYNELVKIINHELVHVVDPKLNKLKESSLKKAKTNEDLIKKLEHQLSLGKPVEEELKEAYKKYLTFPWEIDAYISSEAESRMQSYFRKGMTKNMIQNLLQNVHPNTNIEKFYKSIPEIWKRYTKYLYKLLDAHFNKE